ncbi:MAG: serine hydrolase domain-containing protein, partial [Gemmatimonadota bacterium]|nr:serine hydrolase domain-containing protein [Gemmatimonadota bacterium]
MGKLNLIISMGVSLLLCLETPLEAQISAVSAQAAIEQAQTQPGEDRLGTRTVAELMEEFGVPGVSVAVIQDFKIHWAKAYGVADVETGQLVDIETMFQAASISKPVAAMGVLRAVQDGLFSLDDDINDILDSWTLDGREFTGNRPVTPRTLTSHTSGLGDGFGFPGYDPEQPLPTTVQILEGHELSNVGSVFMEREPMTFYEYSGGGVTVMELALSDVRKRPFVDILQEGVLTPVGMTRSSYAQPISPEHNQNAARAHDNNGDSRGPKWHVYPEHAAAGLWTTPTDLARLIIEVQRSASGESNRVLSQSMIQEMLNPVGVGPFAVGFTVSKVGEGWYFSHGGSNWGFRALMLAHKVKGYGLVVMTNADQGSTVINEISRRI